MIINLNTDYLSNYKRDHKTAILFWWTLHDSYITPTPPISPPHAARNPCGPCSGLQYTHTHTCITYDIDRMTMIYGIIVIIYLLFIFIIIILKTRLYCAYYKQNNIGAFINSLTDDVCLQQSQHIIKEGHDLKLHTRYSTSQLDTLFSISKTNFIYRHIIHCTSLCNQQWPRSSAIIVAAVI